MVSARIGSPASRDLGQGSSASHEYTGTAQRRPHGPPQLAGGPGTPLGAAAAGFAQERGSREKASLSRRSPADSPTFASSPTISFASSPTISAAEATSSAPPGG